MTLTPKRLLIAAVLAASGALAIAQAPAPSSQPAAGEASAARPGPGGKRMDPAQMQQRMAERRAQRLAALKSDLKLTPAQEGAWNQFVAAGRPPAMGQRGPMMDRAQMAQLTTPQRLDLMDKRMAERQAHMKQRSDAVKTFYAQLTPEQQKTFDSRPMRGGRGEGRMHGGGMHGHMHGGPGMMGR